MLEPIASFTEAIFSPVTGQIIAAGLAAALTVCAGAAKLDDDSSKRPTAESNKRDISYNSLTLVIDITYN